jgi:hypothetical protein
MEKQQQPQVVPAQAWYFIRNTVAVGTTLMGQASAIANNQSIKQMESVLPGLKEVALKLEQLLKLAKEEELDTPNQQPSDNAGPKPSA